MRKQDQNKPFVIEFDREEDGRWIAEIPALPGVMAYGTTKAEAQRKVSATALRTLADSVERGGSSSPFNHLFSHGEVVRR